MKVADKFANALLDRQVQRVILRRWKDSKNVIALLPDAGDVGRGAITTYEHVGQHGGGVVVDLMRDTHPVHPGEEGAEKLLAELCSIGYELRVVKRMQRRRA